MHQLTPTRYVSQSWNTGTHTHTQSVRHSHIDWILFYSPLVHGFDSPTIASTGCEVQDSSKENDKSAFV